MCIDYLVQYATIFSGELRVFFYFFTAKKLFFRILFCCWVHSSPQFTLGLINVFKSRFLSSLSAVQQNKIHANQCQFSEKITLSISREKHLKGKYMYFAFSRKRSEYGERNNIIRGLNHSSLIPNISQRSVKFGVDFR